MLYPEARVTKLDVALLRSDRAADAALHPAPADLGRALSRRAGRSMLLPETRNRARDSRNRHDADHRVRRGRPYIVANTVEALVGLRR
jgi:hypothetical protein